MFDPKHMYERARPPLVSPVVPAGCPHQECRSTSRSITRRSLLSIRRLGPRWSHARETALRTGRTPLEAPLLELRKPSTAPMIPSEFRMS